jgi:hypothetical protein
MPDWKIASKYMKRRGVECPTLDDLPFGGVIGEATLVDIVTRHKSKWFEGPYGLVLADARRVPFQPCKGQVGAFVPDI